MYEIPVTNEGWKPAPQNVTENKNRLRKCGFVDGKGE
jgi:hypothetical protein